jgi:hypothetical protein
MYRIVLDWNAKADQSHDASADDNAWPQQTRRTALVMLAHRGGSRAAVAGLPQCRCWFMTLVTGGVTMARSSRLGPAALGLCRCQRLGCLYCIPPRGCAAGDWSHRTLPPLLGSLVRRTQLYDRKPPLLGSLVRRTQLYDRKKGS